LIIRHEKYKYMYNNNNNNNNYASKPQTTINLKAQAMYEYRPTNNVERKVCEDSGGKLLYDRREIQSMRQNMSP